MASEWSEWSELDHQFMELWNNNETRERAEKVRDEYHRLRTRAEDCAALKAALDKNYDPPTVLDDIEYNDILEGDEIWAHIQTNSGR